MDTDGWLSWKDGRDVIEMSMDVDGCRWMGLVVRAVDSDIYIKAARISC